MCGRRDGRRTSPDASVVTDAETAANEGSHRRRGATLDRPYLISDGSFFSSFGQFASAFLMLPGISLFQACWMSVDKLR